MRWPPSGSCSSPGCTDRTDWIDLWAIWIQTGIRSRWATRLCQCMTPVRMACRTWTRSQGKTSLCRTDCRRSRHCCWSKSLQHRRNMRLNVAPAWHCLERIPYTRCFHWRPRMNLQHTPCRRWIRLLD